MTAILYNGYSLVCIYLEGIAPCRDFLCSHSVVLGMGAVESIKYFLYWPLLRIGPAWSELSRSMLFMCAYPLVYNYKVYNYKCSYLNSYTTTAGYMHTTDVFAYARVCAFRSAS